MWRVLMVDDEELIRNAMSSYIEQNFEVEIYRAASSYEALSLLHKMRFDAVITDISMPMMDGIELLRNIKQIWPMCYVIVLTVYDQFEYVYKTLKYERVDYVLKAESYVGIHNALTKAFEILQRAREQERQLLRLGNHVEQMKPQMRNAVVSRLLHKQAELPPQEELEAMDFGLDTTRPVLFAVGLIDRENAAQIPIILSDFSYSVLTRMGSKETIIRNFLSGNYAVWLIQPHKHLEQTEGSNFLMYARDAFEQASENLFATRNLRIPVVMVDQISQWSELADQFYHAAFVLEGMRHTNGLFLMKDFPCKSEKQIIAGLTLEDMTLLWEFLQIGKKDDFLQFMTQKLQR